MLARGRGVLIGTIIHLVVGCSPKARHEPETVRPVKTMVVTAGDEPHVRIFPGKAEASKKAELAFQVPGLLVKFNVEEGKQVKKGELIGQLRQDEFEVRLKVREAQLDSARADLTALQAGDRPEQQRRLDAQLRQAEATLNNARTEVDRYRRLLAQNAISRQEFDRVSTDFRVAQEELEAAREARKKGTVARSEDLEAKKAEVRGLEARVVEANIQLQDSTLRAPFDGVIAQRFVEANQNITAKQPIVKFQDTDEIEVVVDVPEVVMAADLRSADILRLLAEFAGEPGVAFPVYITEIAQRADPATRTFRVRTAMKAPPGANILPGMTARVTTTYRRAGILGGRILVPLSAVYRDADGEQVVWVIGSKQTALRRTVKLGEATGDRIEIVEGLKPGDRIAVAGVTFLRDGMKVRDLGDALGESRS
jgi:RND family efflux transporter MFP subunit